MGKEKKKEQKNCRSKKGLMLAYGLIQFSTSIISALSLIIIAISIYPIKEKSKLFNECVKENIKSLDKISKAVSFCSGGSTDFS